ncbi:MAG TPA: pseudouridine-5'-phosphate glycosidase [Pyrinomonadaceae bacterium]|nr:pseudouridine-5'-phosphate glycosidase [Pyrinomonadaceae bacterium]
MHELLNIASEVANALRDNRPVVALESTVIAHGLPRPQNLETANRLQELIRDGGAVPATIGVIDGQLTVGLSDDQIQLLAQQTNIRKISTRDIPLAVARTWNGATTVASTIWLAHRAGIKVFATGGIGGVHRGLLPDVSADLPELARTPMIVVCSGAKIVLDLLATREWLETHGVTVIGYQCDELPAFYSRGSGLPIDARVESPADVADVFRTQQALGIESALLVVVPVPARFEVAAEELQTVLTTALEDAEWKGITGPALTPFLLNQMAERSGGATLQANIALLENNARVAAEIAREVV